MQWHIYFLSDSGKYVHTKSTENHNRGNVFTRNLKGLETASWCLLEELQQLYTKENENIKYT